MKHNIYGFILGLLLCPLLVYAGLETSTYIDGLIVTNPTGSDNSSTADDHMRLIKSTIKNTFPNITGAVTATHTRLNTLANATSTFNAASTGQTLTKSTINTIIFDIEIFDVGAGYNPVTGIYTVPVTGYYFCTSTVIISNSTISSGSINAVYFSKNNVTTGMGSRFDLNTTSGYSYSINPASDDKAISGTALIQSNSTDTIRIKADVGSNANLLVSPSHYSYFSCYQVG